MVLTNLPTGRLTNEEYRRSRGTDRPLCGTTDQRKARWQKLYATEIELGRALRKRHGHSWKWHRDVLDDEDED